MPYFDFEDHETRARVQKNPIGFIREHIHGAIFDEFHYIPEITEGLKVVADELNTQADKIENTPVPTRFVLTSSHNYLQIKGGITETMVGRASMIELLSMSASELNIDDPYTLIYKGGYPAIYTKGEEPQSYFRNYLKLYLEREVRMVHNISDFSKFLLFMKMCANRVGNLINYEIMSSHLGLTKKVIDHWLEVLRVSYIIFTAPKYHNNFELTLTHQPKLYFYDTGLASFLLDHFTQEDIVTSSMRGALFENLVFSDVNKTIMAANKSLSTYFWQVGHQKQKRKNDVVFEEEKEGYEIDMIISQGSKVKAIEIKMSGTFDPHWLGRLHRFDKEKSKSIIECKKYIIYTGPTMDIPGGKALNFKDIGLLLEAD